MNDSSLNFKIAMTLDQKDDLLMALHEQIRESQIKESDFSLSEYTGSSEFKDLYFEPVTAAAIGMYVLSITASGVASWVVAKALDRFFKGKSPAPHVAQNPVVVVLLPDGEIENLDPSKVTELHKALQRIERAE